MKKLIILSFILPTAVFSQIGIGIRPALTYSSTSTTGYSLSESMVGGFLSFEYVLPLPSVAIELSVGYKNSLEAKETGIKDPISITNSGIDVTGIIRYYLPTASEKYQLFVGGGFGTFLFDRRVNDKKAGSGLTNMNGVAPIGIYYKINPKLRFETMTEFDFFIKSKPEENKTTTRIIVGLNIGIKIFL